MGQSHKGHSQESQNKKCKHFVRHIFFLLLINMLEAPPGTRTLKYARCSATVVPAEKLEPWADIPEQFHNQTQSAQREKTRPECSNRYWGGVKKDTCGAERTLFRDARPSDSLRQCRRYAPGYSRSGWYLSPFSSTPPQKTNTSPFICCTINAALACKTAT